MNKLVLTKTKLDIGLSKVEAMSKRNEFIREGKQARISSTRNGYRVIVQEYKKLI